MNVLCKTETQTAECKSNPNPDPDMVVTPLHMSVNPRINRMNLLVSFSAWVELV